MKQKILIEVGTTEIQKSLDKMIEGIVVNHIRSTVDKIITERLEEIIKARTTAYTIDTLINNEVRLQIGNSGDKSIRERTFDILATKLNGVIAGQLSENLSSALIERSNDYIVEHIRSRVDFELKRMFKAETETQVKEFVQQFLSKVIK